MTINLTIAAADAADLKRQLRELLGDETQQFNTPVLTAEDVSALAKEAAETKAKAKAAAESKAKAEVAKAMAPIAVESVQEAGAKLAAENPATETIEIETDGPWVGLLDVTPEEDTRVSEVYNTTIKPAVLRVSQKHNREGVLKLLEPYNVPNASKITAGHYGELMAEINRLLAD